MIENNDLIPHNVTRKENFMGTLLAEKEESTNNMIGILAPLAGAGAGIIAHSESLSNAGRAQEEENAVVAQRYPMPKDCTDCAKKITLMEQEVETVRQRIANGATKNIGQRTVAALQDRIGKFKQMDLNWECTKQAEDAQAAAFMDSVKDTLNNEEDRAGSRNATTNTFVYIGGALLLCGALLLVLRKAKKD